MTNILNKIKLIIISAILILSTAQSCSLPGFNLFNQKTNNEKFGILKRDPNIIKEGFGFINQVKSGDNINQDALSAFQTTSFKAYTSDNLFTLTKEKGLFNSTNKGQYWERKYIFPINSQKENAKERQDEINSKITRNDQFKALSFSVKDENNYYVSGLDSDKKGKIFKTSDNGQSFKQVYSEFEDNSAVNLVSVDPNNNNIIYGVLSGGSLVRSFDAGSNWQKIQSFKQTPLQIGYLSNQNNLFFALFPSLGLKTSKDNGTSWTDVNLAKSQSLIGESQNRDALNLNPLDKNETFGQLKKITPAVNSNNNALIPMYLIADRQLWFTTDVLTQKFVKIPLPVQNEQNDITDVNYDKEVGISKIYIALNNKLIQSSDSGKSWNVNDSLNLNQDITLGTISSINFDPNNSQVMYLTLSKLTEEKKGLF